MYFSLLVEFGNRNIFGDVLIFKLFFFDKNIFKINNVFLKWSEMLFLCKRKLEKMKFFLWWLVVVVNLIKILNIFINISLFFDSLVVYVFVKLEILLRFFFLVLGWEMGVRKCLMKKGGIF